MMIRVLILSCLVGLGLAGCSGESEVSADSVVLGYFTAMVNADVDFIADGVCSVYEGQARIDFDSFSAVEATLDDARCSIEGVTGDSGVVLCEGRISVSYDGEANELMNLADYRYAVAKEDGLWRLCGYD